MRKYHPCCFFIFRDYPNTDNIRDVGFYKSDLRADSLKSEDVKSFFLIKKLDFQSFINFHILNCNKPTLYDNDALFQKFDFPDISLFPPQNKEILMTYTKEELLPYIRYYNISPSETTFFNLEYRRKLFRESFFENAIVDVNLTPSESNIKIKHKLLNFYLSRSLISIQDAQNTFAYQSPFNNARLLSILKTGSVYSKKEVNDFISSNNSAGSSYVYSNIYIETKQHVTDLYIEEFLKEYQLRINHFTNPFLANWKIDEGITLQSICQSKCPNLQGEKIKVQDILLMLCLRYSLIKQSRALNIMIENIDKYVRSIKYNNNKDDYPKMKI